MGHAPHGDAMIVPSRREVIQPGFPIREQILQGVNSSIASPSRVDSEPPYTKERY